MIEFCRQPGVGQTVAVTAGPVQEAGDEREPCGVDLLQLLPGLVGGVALVVVRHPERHSPRLRKIAAYWVGSGKELGMPPDPLTDPLFPEESESK